MSQNPVVIHTFSSQFSTTRLVDQANDAVSVPWNCLCRNNGTFHRHRYWLPPFTALTLLLYVWSAADSA